MSTNQIKDLVTKNFPNWQAFILITSKSKIDAVFKPNSSFATKKFEEYDLEYIGSLVSIRYGTVRFDKILDGLDGTINIFGKYFMLVTRNVNEIFVVILEREGNLTEEVYSTFKDVAGKVWDLRLQ